MPLLFILFIFLGAGREVSFRPNNLDLLQLSVVVWYHDIFGIAVLDAMTAVSPPFFNDAIAGVCPAFNRKTTDTITVPILFFAWKKP